MTVPQKPTPPRVTKNRKNIYVSQENFRAGPYVISEPDVIVVLTEDVTVNFQEPPLKESPHHLGFFGALVVGASRVTIDLNGHFIKMHPNFRERQRFFSLIALDVTPFPVGKMKFTTQPVSPSDISIQGPGTLGLTSHFCVHGNTLKQGRIQIMDVKMEDFEVGAVSISGASDILIKRCIFGSAIPPTTSSDFLMMKDLADTAREKGAHTEAHELMNAAESVKRHMTSSDAIVRAVVIMPEFNVNGIPDTFDHRINRVSMVDCKFADLRAEPFETVGIAMEKNSEKPFKDRHGNLIAIGDVLSGSVVSRMQAAYSPELPRAVREKLMSGPDSSFHPVYGQDRRGHSLQGKSSLFARVDGCTDVILRNLVGDKVESEGKEGAAVGFMLNGCERVLLNHVAVGGAYVRNVCGDALSDTRPRSGLILRRCKHIKLDDYVYEASDSCGGTFRMSENASLQRCTMNAPATFLHCKNISMD